MSVSQCLTEGDNFARYIVLFFINWYEFVYILVSNYFKV